MCERVRESLPFLLENADGEMSQDTARALLGHLSICTECSQEFDEQQRVAAYLSAVPAVELPMDFTGIIQRKIQVQSVTAIGGSEAVVTSSATGRPFVIPIALEQNSVVRNANSTATPTTLQAAVRPTTSTLASTLKKSNITSSRNILKIEGSALQRLTSGSITAAIMAFFVSSAWGHEMLGENIVAVRSWLEQISTAIGRVPLLGRLMLVVFAALGQMGDLLGETYRNVGEVAVRGLAMDIGVCIAAYYFLVTRKQRGMYGARRV